MYLGYYGLHEAPFSITPDPRFVHLSERHRDALAHLLFGVDKGGSGGFVQLTGEVGTGKTTLSRLLLEQLPEDTRIALVLNPRQDAVELLETICEELHLDIEGKRGSSKSLIDALNVYLLDAYAQGLRVVVLIDEAQNLPADALEQVRLLTNLETHTQKLLQILLLGQPELRDMLARPELRQLSQRITARYHLTPLDARGTEAYLRHRWRVAGGTRFPFTAKGVQRLHARAGGVPRLLNVIAERALLAGYARDATVIDARLVDAAANEVLPPTAKRIWWPWLAAAGVVAVAVIAATQFRGTSASAQTPNTTQAVSASNTPATSATPDHIITTTIPLDATGLTQLIGATGDTPLPGWQALLELWQLPADSITVDPAGPCRPATNPEIHCVQGDANLDTLLAVDRPVLLRLRDAGSDAWALLLGADVRRVRIRIGEHTHDIDRVLLLARWNGRYASLWQGPAMLGSAPRPGTSGPAVDWLRLQLTPLHDVVPGLAYDGTVRAGVTILQQARGIPVDGIAGPLTLMALASELPGPRLLRVLD
ncbi:ExeA family protein [Thermomonas sp.]|uniref:ExeA family protein n=1 Tax=Thermomonas sp. TaxID=1971895 RepID=UPI002488629B|nr:ExeA family protein [Thermomonas sp.]MDI1253934.1 AAA family ATPase [Thermomonas sp.]